MTNGRILQEALGRGVRACYSSLKGVVIALYEFLEEEPYPTASTISLTSTESGAMRGDSLKLGDILEARVTETVLGNGLAIDYLSELQGGLSPERAAIPTQTDTALDWAISVGFLRAEAVVDNLRTVGYNSENVLAMGDSSGNVPAVGDDSKNIPMGDGSRNIPATGDGSRGVPTLGDDSKNLPTVAGDSSNLFSCGVVTTDIQVHTGRLP